MLSIRLSLSLSGLIVSMILAACSSAPPLPTVSPPVVLTPPMPSQEILRPTTFAALPGWDKDNVREVWPALLSSCEVLIKKADWKEPCNVAREVDASNEKSVRTFFESFFVPQQVINSDGSDSGLITGYYEPLLHGARKRGGIFQTALHRVPEDLLTLDLGSVYPTTQNMRLRGRLVGNKVVPYFSRTELTAANVLAGKELLWVNDPIDAFFLQVQGSGRVQLADSNETVRVAYADQNGHPYKSIGKYLVDKGELKLEQASAQGIKAWIAANPARLQEVLNANPSYVFFKEEKIQDASKGPKGALGVPLTAQRSIAVDTQVVPLGAPVFLATTRPNSDIPLQRLTMAQDTGGAIRGSNRADFFFGFGAEAGENAGRMKQRGMMWILLPRSVPAGK